MRDLLSDDVATHKINGEVPRVGVENTPESTLDYRVMGHVKDRVEMLQKRRGPPTEQTPAFTIEFNPLEKTLYVVPNASPLETIWLFGRVGGQNEWGAAGLQFIKMDRNELLLGVPLYV